jgi:hypothetical protein
MQCRDSSLKIVDHGAFARVDLGWSHFALFPLNRCRPLSSFELDSEEFLALYPTAEKMCTRFPASSETYRLRLFSGDLFRLVAS